MRKRFILVGMVFVFWLILAGVLAIFGVQDPFGLKSTSCIFIGVVALICSAFLWGEKMYDYIVYVASEFKFPGVEYSIIYLDRQGLGYREYHIRGLAAVLEILLFIIGVLGLLAAAVALVAAVIFAY